MARVNITEKIWYDPEVKNYVMLDVTDDIPRPLPFTTHQGVLLEPKTEYHCTLVAAGKLSDDPTAVQEVIEDIAQYIKARPNDIAYEGLGDDYYICQKAEETTLIVSAIATGLIGLREVVRGKFPEYEDTSPHITLLKSENSAYGIGINSLSDLDNYCQKIEMPSGLFGSRSES